VDARTSEGLKWTTIFARKYQKHVLGGRAIHQYHVSHVKYPVSHMRWYNMEYSMIHMKTIDELGEMARKCQSMKELNNVMIIAIEVSRK